MQLSRGTWKVRKQEETPLLLPLLPITGTEVQFSEHILHTCSQHPSNACLIQSSWQKKHQWGRTWYVNSNCFSNWNLSPGKKVSVSQEESCTGVEWSPTEIKMFTVILTMTNSWSHFYIFNCWTFGFSIDTLLFFRSLKQHLSYDL